MLLNYRFIIILILINFIPINQSYSKNFIIKDAIEPYCNGINSEEFLLEKKIKNIEIVTNNPKKWVKNIFSALVEFNDESSKTENKNWFNYRIKEKYKKYFNSTLLVNFKDSKVSCKFKAKVKITGDLWWHLDWKNGSALTSIQVKLLDGHINNITRFKLFLPSAREGGDNEIFVSTLLTELDFLAPRTLMVKSKINGIAGDYIFQEDLRKEFLENFKLVDGPLLEGDERLTIMLMSDRAVPDLSLSRIINKNFSLKDETSQETALVAVSNLNLIYLQHHQSKSLINQSYLPTDRLHINTEKFFVNYDNKVKYQTYDSLIYALDAYHSLSFDDRRFYFDPIYQNFVPIYYDGKSKITNIEQKSRIESLSTDVSIDAKRGAKNAISLIKKINHKKFQVKLTNNGLHITNKKYNQLFEKIVSRLEVIKNADPAPVKFSVPKNYFSNLKNNIKKNRKLIFVNLKKKEFYICSFDLNNCQTKKNNLIEFNESLAEILSQRYVNNDKLTPAEAENLFVYNDLNYHQPTQIIKNIWNIKKINDDFSIKYNKDIIVNIFSEKKEIIVKQKSNSGRAIFIGKKIDGWNIFFNANKNNISNLNIPKNYLNLNGCLTFLDIEVININLNSKNSHCEDSINFIRVNGTVNNINITNSYLDALDIDFSTVELNSVIIKSAGNDCLDLSNGKYKISDINIENCGDKGISIGEKSETEIQNVLVNHSNIAIAAKDSSIVKINKSQIFNSAVCFSAYRKKQEFSGAKIEINDTNCNKDNSYAQNGSKIIFNL
jgi:hypothetical protein